MKLLFITPSLSYPPSKGYEVMLLKLMENLASRHSIDLVMFSSDPAITEFKAIEDICNSVRIIYLSKWQSLINVCKGLISKDPLQVRYYRSKKMTDLINQLLLDNNYDAAIFTLIRTAQFLPDWYKGTKILNMIDPLILNYERSLKWRPWYLRLPIKQEVSRLLEYEAANINRFDSTTLISKADIIDYQSLMNSPNTEWVPYGIDINRFQSDKNITREKGMIVITGNMGYAPNVDGVIYFCQKIFPAILEQEPEAHLWLVGINPTLKIKELATNKNITVTGYVEDVKYYLNRAMVSVCPIRLGVGTQTKVLEAMSMGTPVVTTSEGNHGICGVSGLDLFVADSPKEIADKVVNLLRANNWNKLSDNGRKFVIENFNWSVSSNKFECILNTSKKCVK
jgi:polysaccharide biosynthesis protein PslH